MTSDTFKNTQHALQWMLQRNMLVKSKTKDPETFAMIQGFLLSNEMRERIGSNLMKLVAKATGRQSKDMKRVTIRDAFLTATIAALLENTHGTLTDDKMTECANVVFAFLPIGRLEQAGLDRTPLRTFAREGSLVIELQRILKLRD